MRNALSVCLLTLATATSVQAASVYNLTFGDTARDPVTGQTTTSVTIPSWNADVTVPVYLQETVTDADTGGAPVLTSTGLGLANVDVLVSRLVGGPSSPAYITAIQMNLAATPADAPFPAVQPFVDGFGTSGFTAGPAGDGAEFLLYNNGSLDADGNFIPPATLFATPVVGVPDTYRVLLATITFHAGPENGNTLFEADGGSAGSFSVTPDGGDPVNVSPLTGTLDITVVPLPAALPGGLALLAGLSFLRRLRRR